MSRLLNSTVAVFFGFPMIIGAIILLYWNDGRFDTSNLARTAIAVDAGRPDSNLDGKPVSITGTLATKETTGDGLYLKPGNYLAVHRSVEEYAWTEESHTEGRGSETTYTYSTDWFASPTPTANFKQPAGHGNPPLAVTNGDFHPKASTLGAYVLDLTNLSVPGSVPLTLTADNTNLSTGGTLVDGQSIYVGKGSFTTPEVGDLLIRYEAVPSGLSVTAYGTPHGSTFQRFVDGSGNELYGIYLGTPADAVEEMHSSYVSSLWFFRFTGFFLLWGGMFLIFRPLLAVFRVIPILGEIATASVAAVTFVGALTLTLITIIVSLILHSIIALIVVVLLIVGVIAFRHRLSLNGLARFRTGRVI